MSDTSLAQLHAFAAAAAVPERSFDGDHYDVPAERHGDVVRAGARLVTGRELVTALQRSGLRLPKRRGERVLATWAEPPWPGLPLPEPPWPPGLAGHRVDCIASPLSPPGPVLHRWLISLDDEGRLGLDGDRLPAPDAADPRCGYLRIRLVAAPWSYVALYTRRRDEYPQQAGHAGPGVPLELVRGVRGQEYWWPLLLHVRSSRPR